MSRFRLIVFDLDGTLVDSRHDIAESANATLVACGAKALPEDAIGRMVGNGAPVLVARAFAAAGAAKPPDALERFLSIYGARLLDHTRPYDGIPFVLEELAARAATLAVLTNKPIEATRQILQGLDLWRHFSPERVVGGDGPWPLKPDPEGLRHLMVSCNTPAEATVLVGDSVVDWRTARGAAAQACVARYGFGWEGFSADQIGADDWVIDSPPEILQCLE